METVHRFAQTLLAHTHAPVCLVTNCTLTTEHVMVSVPPLIRKQCIYRAAICSFYKKISMSVQSTMEIAIKHAPMWLEVTHVHA